MSTTLEQPEVQLEETPHVGPSPASVLIDRLPENWKWTPAIAGFACLLSIHFLMMSHQPLPATEVWENLAYGREIVTQKSLPSSEPFLNLQRGIPVVDTSWLGQVSAYLMYQTWGLSALQFLQAVFMTGCLIALATFGYRKTRSVGWTVASLAMFYLLNWHQFGLLRPQSAGLFFFILLVTQSTARRLTPRHWMLVASLFAVWANVHGSFLAGLAWLGCLTVGRGVDLWRRSGSWSAILHDLSVKRLVMLAELSFLATLLNPFGLGVYGELLRYVQSTNLRDMIEWDPLQIRSFTGVATALSALSLIVVYRYSPKRISTAEFLAHLVFGGLALWNSVFLPWWSVVAVTSVVIHGAAATRKCPAGMAAQPVRAGRWSVITLAMVWIAFGFSPFGSRLLHGAKPDSKKSLSSQVPADLATYLQKNQLQGQVFNTMEVGDYLLWAGPRDLKLFMTSRVDLAPREVWKAYIGTINGGADWKDHLDRYGVNTIILDKLDRKTLISDIREDANWKRDYEDNVAVVFVRRKPL